jgi:hypothetical protein
MNSATSSRCVAFITATPTQKPETPPGHRRHHPHGRMAQRHHQTRPTHPSNLPPVRPQTLQAAVIGAHTKVGPRFEQIDGIDLSEVFWRVTTRWASCCPEHPWTMNEYSARHSSAHALNRPLSSNTKGQSFRVEVFSMRMNQPRGRLKRTGRLSSDR